MGNRSASSQPQRVAVLLQRDEGGAHHPQVVFVTVAGLHAVARLRLGLSTGLPLQLSMCHKSQRETEEGVCEVCVLLSNTDIHTSVGGLEGANQEASIRVHDTIIQPDLRDKERKRFIPQKKVMSDTDDVSPSRRQTCRPADLQTCRPADLQP
ncbi:hypothetical protein EYF80_041441 [Liparis tanakae]|uniref:Uncharacterized protein n=1 Tax=Liparis tanakae TaxID=230148 RepID=A0A4Z2G724_9TELE|nr:hypothetical protein EYF80_041441 [Liparis tanakae]